METSSVTGRRKRIAYIHAQFPRLSDTFVLSEICELEKLGWEIISLSLRNVQESDAWDSSMIEWKKKTVYAPYLLSGELLFAHLEFLLAEPREYLTVLATLILSQWRSPRTLATTLAVFPKTVLFAKWIRLRGVTHVHTHFAWISATSAWIVSQLIGVDFSFTAHAFDIFSRDHRDPLLPRKIRDCAFVVVISEHNRNRLLKIAGGMNRSKIHVVHMGVDVTKFHSQVSRRGLAKEPLILSVGRFVEKKGHEYLVEAARILRDRGYRFTCLVVGGGPCHGHLQSLIRERALEEYVVLKGPTSNEEVRELLKKADVFCLPCVVARNMDRDGIPVALMEAMAMEVPVVSTYVSGIPELIGDGETGLLVPQRDSLALADAIESLLLSPELRRTLGEKARQRITAQFEASKSAAQMQALFEVPNAT